jgi:hypothetical protein
MPLPETAEFSLHPFTKRLVNFTDLNSRKQFEKHSHHPTINTQITSLQQK